MAKCPKCNEEINSLICSGSVDAYYEVRLLDGKSLEYDEVSSASAKDAEYECPACEEEIITGYDEALAFLKGEVKKEEQAKL